MIQAKFAEHQKVGRRKTISTSWWIFRRIREVPGRAFWRECVVFTVLFTLVSYLLDLPLTLYHRHLALAYGLSVQGWASWFGDQLKSLGLSLLGSVLFFALLMWLMRRLPSNSEMKKSRPKPRFAVLGAN